jgi:hypothetical protein
MQRAKGTGTAPVPHWLELAFPITTITGALFFAELPPDANATPSPSVKLFWKANAVANSCKWTAYLAAFSNAATTALPAHNFAAANTVTTATGTTTARQMNTTTIALTNADSIAAGQTFSLLIQRNVGGADSLLVDAELLLVEFSYTI